MKTKEELQQLQEELQQLNEKLKELSEDELIEIAGGDFWEVIKKIGDGIHSVAKPIVKNVVPSIPINKIDPNNK